MSEDRLIAENAPIERHDPVQDSRLLMVDRRTSRRLVARNTHEKVLTPVYIDHGVLSGHPHAVLQTSKLLKRSEGTATSARSCGRPLVVCQGEGSELVCVANVDAGLFGAYLKHLDPERVFPAC